MISPEYLWQTWTHFFHTPEPVATLCLFRIALGLLVAFNAACLMPYADDLFGPSGVFGALAYERAYRNRRISLFWLAPRSPRAPKLIMTLLIVSALCVSAGFCTRFTTPLAWLCLLSLHNRNALAFNAGDTVQRLLFFLLCFAPSGAALSIDCWLHNANMLTSLRDEQFDPWALRLIQIQMSIIYIRTVGWKLRGDKWRNGTAVAYALRLADFHRATAPAFLHNTAIIKLATYGTLVAEAFVGVGVWINGLRYPAIITGWLLHASIETFLNVHLFGLAMCVGLLTFLPPDDVANWLLSLGGYK